MNLVDCPAGIFPDWMRTNAMRVLIVGAGPTGLTAAIELARRGIIPEIIDQRDGASSLSRTVGITPRSLSILSESGVSEKLIAEGVAMNGLCVYYGQEPPLSCLHVCCSARFAAAEKLLSGLLVSSSSSRRGGANFWRLRGI